MVKTRTCSMMMQHQKMINKKKRKSNNKMLVRVNVVGSTGPVRLVVKKDDLVAVVVKSALRAYANDGRLLSGRLGSYNHKDFLLYSSNYNGFTDYSQALKPGEAIGRSGRRNFVLCKKQLNQATTTSEGSSDVVNGISQKVSFSSLKAWFNRHFARIWLGC